MSDPIESIPLGDVAELLAAIRDVLDVPQARDHADSRKEDSLRQARVAWVIGATGALAGGEESPYIISATLASVRTAADYHPVTYPPYVPAPDPAAGALAEQRHQLCDPAVPPLAAAGPDPDYLASVEAGYVDLPVWEDDVPAPARKVATVPVAGEVL